MNWNIARHAPSSWQARSLLAEIQQLNPDLVCLTEAWNASAAPLGGYAISAPGVAWSDEHPDERKVVLWSQNSWGGIELIEQLETTGSAITGTTLFAGKLVRIVGVCIPYNFASPVSQETRAKPWTQHERFLEDLAPLLRRWRDQGPVIVLGDFNQFIPRVWGPKRSYELLEAAFAGYRIVTAGEIESVGARAIDHVAGAGDVQVIKVYGLPAELADGRKRSDHFGVVVDFDVMKSAQNSVQT
ncbi:endonuclease/exonuclease/phosphatase family protein [Hyphomonas sp.]|uniref:endonuclease/exonuclease/phosphatase family protein n=1 Tax=Hyphomonas sp. TaxID=87 RepID=UPI00391C4B45